MAKPNENRNIFHKELNIFQKEIAKKISPIYQNAIKLLNWIQLLKIYNHSKFDQIIKQMGKRVGWFLPFLNIYLKVPTLWVHK
jgi:hypothetical protein